MKPEDKELLFKDLSGRLPYHVRCKIWLEDGTTEEGPLDLEHNYGDVLQDAFYYDRIKDIKPYLRPLSSMTEEEKKEYNIFFEEYAPDDRWPYLTKNFVEEELVSELIDWLNKKMFDFRGLIPKGLALSTEIYNPYVED